MNLTPLITACFVLGFFLGCSSKNLDKEFDCEGTKIKFNDYERFFEVGGIELSSQQDFFMNQITIFGKFNHFDRFKPSFESLWWNIIFDKR